MKKVLVTGANGFVGYYLVKLLLRSGHFVLATGRGPNLLPFVGPDFRYKELDFTNEASVDAVLLHERPDVVVHLGAISKPDECEQERERAFLHNVTGTQYLLATAQELCAHFIFLSTDFVFDGEKGMYSETDERSPVNYYGQTKLLAEDAVMCYAGLWTIVRTVLVYGRPFQSRQNIVSNVANGLREGKSLKIFTDQLRTPTYVEDLAKGLLAIIEKKAGGIFHLSGKDIRSPYAIAVAVAHRFGYDTNLIQPVTESEFDQPARRPPRTGFNLTKARTELGYEPISFLEGLQKTFADD